MPHAFVPKQTLSICITLQTVDLPESSIILCEQITKETEKDAEFYHHIFTFVNVFSSLC